MRHKTVPSADSLVREHLDRLPERAEILLDSIMQSSNGMYPRSALELTLRQIQNNGGPVARVMTGRYFKVSAPDEP